MARSHYILDETTASTKTVDYAHHEIHEGDAFTCHYTQNTPTNIGEMTVIAFNTPNTTKWLHLVATATASYAASFRIVQAPSIDVDEGTQLAIYNRNLNSANTSGVSSIATVPVAGAATSYTVAQAAGANITTTATLHYEEMGAAGNPATANGGGSRGTVEWVLKQNTQYAFILANLDANTSTHNIILNWYEHTNLSAE